MTVGRFRFGGDALIAALAVLGLIVLAVWRERLDAPVTDTFSASDYRSGGYAAWADLLAREGQTTERFERRPTDLNAAIDTLIEAAPAVPVELRTPAEDAALLDWIRAGGRAIRLGRSVFEIGTRELQAPATRDAAGGGALHGTFVPFVSSLAATGSARFRPAKKPQHDAILLADRGGPLIVRRGVGRGEIVFVTTPQLFANGAIARADNARLAFLLGRPRIAGGRVAFDEALHGTIVDRVWWQTLSIPVRVSLAGVALAIVLAVLGGALRLGPPVSTVPPREPASDEFITAIAVLYERSGARAYALGILADGTRDPALRALAANPQPTDRDVIAGAARARTLRAETI